MPLKLRSAESRFTHDTLAETRICLAVEINGLTATLKDGQGYVRSEVQNLNDCVLSFRPLRKTLQAIKKVNSVCYDWWMSICFVLFWFELNSAFNIRKAFIL